MQAAILDRGVEMSRLSYSAMALMAVSIAGIAPASAGTTNCPGNIINRTVDNVFVNGSCIIRNSTVEGNIVVSTKGDLLVQGSTIKGSVQSEGGSRVRLQTNPANGRETAVNGDIQIFDTVAGLTSAITDVNVGGSIQLDSNAAPIVVRFNDVGSDVQVFQNAARVRLGGNTIDGNLQCKENTPPPLNEGGNVVEGSAEDQCSGFGER
ncbi:MAG: hypothetical protein MUE49_06585 [Rhodospirillales bacterium]|nr:hypothetical protein [Rhodospirillales bacterium]